MLSPTEYGEHLVCDSFLEARAAMEEQAVAAFLPNFLAAGKASKSFIRVEVLNLDSRTFQFHLAWNPRLLRLNPHAAQMRGLLAEALTKRIAL